MADARLPGAHGSIAAPSGQPDPVYYRWFQRIESAISSGLISQSEGTALIDALTLRVASLESEGTAADLIAVMYGTNGVNVFGNLANGVEIRGPDLTGLGGGGFPGKDGEDGQDGWPMPGPAGRQGYDGPQGPGIYLALDNDTGEQWPLPGPAGALGATGPSGGGSTLIASATVAGAAATNLTVSGLDLTTAGRYRIVIKSKSAAAGGYVRLFFNADTTTTNYELQAIYGQGASAGFRANTADLFYNYSGEATIVFGEITNDLNGRPKTTIRSVGHNLATSTTYFNGHYWTTIANVTSMTLSAATASDLAIGTTIEIWSW